MAKGTPRASLETFLAASPELLFIAGRDGKVVTWSDALARALNPALDQGTHLSELAHPDDRAALVDALAHVAKTGETARVHARLAGPDGRYADYVCLARRSPDGDEIHGSLREPSDSADLKQLKDKSGILDKLADNLPIVVYMLDQEGVFTYHDGKVLEGSGLKRNAFLGRSVFEVFADEPLVSEMARKALGGETAHYYSIVYDVDWETWIIPMYDEAGVLQGGFGISVDVSEAKRAQRELQDRIEQISKQQEVIRNLSTPIIEVWDGVLTLPMVGVVDSIRTAEVMDSLLERIVSSQSRFAILDLTGVEVVDTRVASHLLQLVSAIRLLGAEGIVAGIKPTVAQTMVALGLDLSQIVTQRNLRAALSYCIRRMAAQAKPAPSPAAAPA